MKKIKPIKPDVFIPIQWGTHITCPDCGTEVERGVNNYATHKLDFCIETVLEDAECEVIEPKQIENNDRP